MLIFKDLRGVTSKIHCKGLSRTESTSTYQFICIEQCWNLKISTTAPYSSKPDEISGHSLTLCRDDLHPVL
jgi:hypothetical protein